MSHGLVRRQRTPTSDVAFGQEACMVLQYFKYYIRIRQNYHDCNYKSIYVDTHKAKQKEIFKKKLWVKTKF